MDASQRQMLVGALAAAGAYLEYRRMSRKVTEMEAREQMKEYAAMYTRGIDRLDPAMVRVPFTEDATMDIPNIEGDLPIKDFSMGATDFLGKTLVASMHNTTNHHIIFDRSLKTAKSEIYFIANHFKLIDGSVVNAAVYGRYCDKWLKCPDGKWRIVKRKLLYDFQGSDWNKTVKDAANNDDLVQKPVEARKSNLGSRDKNDFTYTFMFPELGSGGSAPPQAKKRKMTESV